MRFLKDTIETSAMLAAHAKVKKFQLVGSALYHPEPKDLDFLVLVDHKDFLMGARWAFGSEWDLCGDYDLTGDLWGAIRKGNVNLILTVDAAWYDRAALANEVCHTLKLMDKADRMAVYRVIRDGRKADDPELRRL
jgi:hypothetical protein